MVGLILLAILITLLEWWTETFYILGGLFALSGLTWIYVTLKESSFWKAKISTTDQIMKLQKRIKRRESNGYDTSAEREQLEKLRSKRDEW